LEFEANLLEIFMEDDYLGSNEILYFSKLSKKHFLIKFQFSSFDTLCGLGGFSTVEYPKLMI